MRKGLRRAVLVVCCGAVLACGGGKPPQSAANKNAEGKAQASSVTPRPELTPVAVPADLFAVARFSSPSLLADTMGRWSNVTVDWRAMLRDMAGPIDQVLMLDAPVEAAAMLDASSRGTPKVWFAVSIGLSSVDGARQYLEAKGAAITNASASSYRVELGEARCLLAYALGKAPARLVCSDKQRALDELGPYMTRGLPGEALTQSDILVELRAEPWRKRFGRQVQMVKLGVPFALRELELDHPELDAVLSETLYALADEVVLLADDLDAIRLVGKLEPRSETLDLAASVKLRSQKSWFGQFLREVQTQMVGPNEAFWLLPGSAYEASYQGAGSGEKQKQFVTGMTKLLRAGLSYLGVPHRMREDTAAAWRVFLEESTPGAYASGEGKLAPGQNADPKYHLMTMGSKAQVEQLLRQLYAVYIHPAPRKTLEAKLGAGKWPQVTSKNAPAGSGLPAGSVVYEASLPESLRSLFTSKEKAGGASKLYVTALNHGGRSWVAAAMDEKVLYQQVAFVTGGGALHTLASNRAIDRLREQQALSAGFVTLKSWLAALEEAAPDAMPPLSRLEHGGTAPILQRVFTGQAGTELTFSLSFPKAALADVANLTMAAVANEGGLETR